MRSPHDEASDDQPEHPAETGDHDIDELLEATLELQELNPHRHIALEQAVALLTGGYWPSIDEAPVDAALEIADRFLAWLERDDLDTELEQILGPPGVG